MISAWIERRVTILRVRAYVFVSLVILGLIWASLLSVICFMKDGFRSSGESAAVFTFLVAQVVSIISIPLLVLADSSPTIEKFPWYSHVWFELLSLDLLLAFQICGSLLYTILSPSFICINENADQEGECQLMHVYISFTSWLTPIIFVLYITYITAVCIRRNRVYRPLWRTPLCRVPWDNEELFPAASSQRTLSSSYSDSYMEKKPDGSSARPVSRFSGSHSETSSQDPSGRVLRAVPREVISLPMPLNVNRNSIQPPRAAPRVALAPRSSPSWSPIISQFPNPYLLPTSSAAASRRPSVPFPKTSSPVTRHNHASQSTLPSVYSESSPVEERHRHFSKDYL